MINLEFTIQNPGQLQALGLQKVRKGVRTAIRFGGRKLLQISRDNFGKTGLYRPTPWAKLSKRYAKKVGRSYATLKVTGNLYRSMVLTKDEHSFKVEAYNFKASPHQRGTRTLPSRPFLPKDRMGRLSPYVKILLEKEIVKGFLRGIK